MWKTLMLVALGAFVGCGDLKDEGYTPVAVRDCDDTDGTVSRVEECGASTDEFAPVLCSRPDATRVAGCAVHLVNGQTAQPWTMACVSECPR